MLWNGIVLFIGIMLLTRKKLLNQKKLQYIVQMYCYSYLKAKKYNYIQNVRKKNNKVVMKNLILVPARAIQKDCQVKILLN